MDQDIIRLTQHLKKKPGCDEQLLDSLEARHSICLPNDYRRFLLNINGGTGPIGVSGFLKLFSVPDEFDRNNELYDIRTRLPGLLMFADDGGSRAFFLDSRNTPVAYVELYWPLDEEEIEIIGTTFSSFLKHVACET